MPRTDTRLAFGCRRTAGLTAVLAIALSSGCRKNSTLDDIPPAPGDPYANATTAPNRVPEAEQREAKPATPDQNGGAPIAGTRPEPQPEAQPKSARPASPARPAQTQSQPAPKQTPQPAAAAPAAAPAPKKRVADEAGNQKKVGTFERCRAKCDSRTDLSSEDKPTCKLECINATAASDTPEDNCKRDCLREANRCYNPCEASKSASCRQGCAQPLLSCMNECDLSAGDD